MCFRMLDQKQKTISFEYAIADSSSDKEMTTGGDIDPFAESLRDLSKQLDLIYRNLHFY